MESSALESLFNHIALPARLPDRVESQSNALENSLIDRVLASVKQLSGLTNDRYGKHLECIRRSLHASKVVNTNGRLNKATLLTAFRELSGDDFLMVHITEQNAAMIIRPQNQ